MKEFFIKWWTHLLQAPVLKRPKQQVQPEKPHWDFWHAPTRCPPVLQKARQTSLVLWFWKFKKGNLWDAGKMHVSIIVLWVLHISRYILSNTGLFPAANSQPASPLTTSDPKPVDPSLFREPPARWTDFSPTQRYPCVPTQIDWPHSTQHQASFFSPQHTLSPFIDPPSLKVLQNVMQIILESSALWYLFFIISLLALETVQLNLNTIILVFTQCPKGNSKYVNLNF